MLRLRSSILAHLLSSSQATSPASPLHRLLSVAISPSTGFAVENYLFSTCGLTRAQAVKASRKLPRLKSPANPDAVLAFLAGLGLSGADAAAVVAKDPQLLCASVERTLAPIVAGLSDLGLSRSEIARLASLAAHRFRRKDTVSKLEYHLRLFRSSENLLRAMKFCDLISHSLERVVKPNVALLRECGLGDCDIAKLCISRPRMITANPELVQAMVTCAEDIGVPRGSVMFRHALHAVASVGKEEILLGCPAKVEYLRNTFRWTDAEVAIAVSKAPAVLTKAKESLQRRSKFLICELGLEPAHIAYRPAMLMYSLEGRIRPRHYVIKFLKENGLLKCDPSYYTVFKESEKTFKKKFIHPHKEAAPNLEKDYDAACKGEEPTNFRFT
ncbi:hypothetical protein CFC21_074062 [Triticum aestivum]|uniref:Uncharacterized protein n=3 Tax=Triticum TaxID=4564 RepID=A0A9R1AS48_TRITD|nr:uncharacterized protein LOC123113723 [Triticum aestivum]KAF7068287.1 hypothetical protein CFC21_074062 [Triticum aestivum]VAI38167.1 unnamed protein product [Triticum turgidum subsp. durum]